MYHIKKQKPFIISLYYTNVHCNKQFNYFTGKHEWLLGDEVDLLPALLLPLAGPEEFDDEDNESLPLDLQYLPPDKTREGNKDIRKMLVEAVFQVRFLCLFIKTDDNKQY